jgi:flagellar assembly protein FliH
MAKSGVIKSSDPGASVPLGAVFSLSDIARQAEGLVAEARRRADETLAEAKARAERIAGDSRKRGYEAGFAEGRAAGRKAGAREALEAATQRFAEQTQSLTAALRAVLEDVEARKLRLMADAEGDLLALAHAIAEKIVKVRVQMDSEPVKENLAAAIRHVARASNLTVLVNPADLEAAQTFTADLVRRIDGLEAIEALEDPAVGRGGCVVKYGVGRIDGRIETQLEQIARQLLGDTPSLREDT